MCAYVCVSNWDHKLIRRQWEVGTWLFPVSCFFFSPFLTKNFTTQQQNIEKCHLLSHHKSQTAVSRRLTAACDTKVRYKSASDAAAREAPPWFTPVWRLAVRHINRRRNGKTGLLTSGRAGTYKSSASGLILTALSAGARDSLAGWRVREARAELRESLGCCWPVRPARKSWAAVNLKGRAPIWRLSFFFFFF